MVLRCEYSISKGAVVHSGVKTAAMDGWMEAQVHGTKDRLELVVLTSEEEFNLPSGS